VENNAIQGTNASIFFARKNVEKLKTDQEYPTKLRVNKTLIASLFMTMSLQILRYKFLDIKNIKVSKNKANTNTQFFSLLKPL
jgi:hypothetical protein